MRLVATLLSFLSLCQPYAFRDAIEGRESSIERPTGEGEIFRYLSPRTVQISTVWRLINSVSPNLYVS